MVSLASSLPPSLYLGCSSLTFSLLPTFISAILSPPLIGVTRGWKLPGGDVTEVTWPLTSPQTLRLNGPAILLSSESVNSSVHGYWWAPREKLRKRRYRGRWDLTNGEQATKQTLWAMCSMPRTLFKILLLFTFICSHQRFSTFALYLFLFIYLLIFLAIPCSLWDFSSWTKGLNSDPWQCELRTLTTGLPGNSLNLCTLESLRKLQKILMPEPHPQTN